MRWTGGFAAVAAALLALGCVRTAVIEGLPCPCATDQGFACCPATSLCVPEAEATAPACRAPGDGARPADTRLTDASTTDAPPPDAPPPDAPPADATPPPDAPPADATSSDTPPPDVPTACPTDAAGVVSAVYFDEREFMSRRLSRTEPGLTFAWPTGSPDPMVAATTWSALFRGQIQADVTDDYTFFVRADNPFNLWLAGEPSLYVAEAPAGPLTVAFTRRLLEGRRYDYSLEYQHLTGPGHLEVTWQRPGGPRTPLPACALLASTGLSASCTDADTPCEYPFPLDCPAFEGLGVTASFFARPDFTSPLHVEPSSTIRPDWKGLLSEIPAVVDTQSVRLEGKVRLARAESYSFFLLADPAADVLLVVDGREQRLVADGAGIIREIRLDVPFTGSTEYPLRIDYVLRVPPDRMLLKLDWRGETVSKRDVGLCFLYNR
jgi:hypothetical protein